jgi:hypothetical protein
MNNKKIVYTLSAFAGLALILFGLNFSGLGGQGNLFNAGVQDVDVSLVTSRSLDPATNKVELKLNENFTLTRQVTVPSGSEVTPSWRWNFDEQALKCFGSPDVDSPTLNCTAIKLGSTNASVSIFVADELKTSNSITFNVTQSALKQANPTLNTTTKQQLTAPTTTNKLNSTTPAKITTNSTGVTTTNQIQKAN